MAVMIYGASGGLGKMVSGAVRDLGMPVVLAGRQRARLESVAREGDRLHTPDQPWPKEIDVVINCAPLSDTEQNRLVQQCLDSGSHLVDASGDQARIFDLLERWDEPAREAGLCILPGLGFDYSVGDCLALIAGGFEPEWDLVVVAYALGEAASDATLEFATQGPRGPERVYREGRWQSVPFELDWGRFDFPGRVGRRQVGRYGSGEVATIPRHTRTRNVRTVITASSLVPHPLLLPFFPLLRPLVGWILKTPLRRVIGWLGALLRRLRPARKEPDAAATPEGTPRGPSFMVVAEAHRGPQRPSCCAWGSDCYDTTARALALAALWLTEGKALQKGAISAGMAFNPFEFLEHLPGVDWEFIHWPTFTVPESPPAQ